MRRLLPVAVLSLLAVGCSEDLQVRPELHQSVLPAIERHLQDNPDLRGSLADRSSRWFCSEHIIEIRERGDELLVGLVAHCDEYVELDGALGAGSGYRGAKLVTLAKENGGYVVTAVESAKDGDQHRASIEAMFTPAGVEAVFDRRSHNLDNTAAEAKAAFGLEPDAPVIPGR